MTKYLVFTEEQFEAGIAELATLSFHGGFLARREIGDPVAVLDALPAAPSPAPLDVRKLPEWEALRAAVRLPHDATGRNTAVRYAARALLAAADREEPT